MAPQGDKYQADVIPIIPSLNADDTNVLFALFPGLSRFQSVAA
jgi:hypothetical protein